MPSRASANESTIDSMRVGNCHATGVSGVMPRPSSPAATRSLHAVNSPKLTVRSCSSMSIGASGERSARRSSSSHNVDASSITSVTRDTPWLVEPRDYGNRRAVR